MAVGAVILAGSWYLLGAINIWVVLLALAVSMLVDGFMGYDDVRVPKYKETTEYTKRRS